MPPSPGPVEPPAGIGIAALPTVPEVSPTPRRRARPRADETEDKKKREKRKSGGSRHIFQNTYPPKESIFSESARPVRPEQKKQPVLFFFPE